MISVLNYKKFDRGSIKGFFDLRYHGLTIKSCRLMDGKNGLWFSFPQIKGEQDGEVKYFDQIFLTPLERDHVRNLILAELQAGGHIERPKRETKSGQPRRSAGKHKTPEGEDLSEYYSGSQDDIPF